MILLKNYTIKTKIMFISLFATMIILMLTMIILIFADYLNQSFSDMHKKELQIKNISYNLKDNISNFHTYILTQALDKKKGKEEFQKIKFLNNKIQEDFRTLRNIMTQTNNIELLEILEKLDIRYKSYFEMAHNLPKQFTLNSSEGLDSLIGINDISLKMFEELDFFILQSNSIFDTRFDQINNNISSIILVFVSISLISLVLFLSFGYLLKKTILDSLKNLENGIDDFFAFLSKKSDVIKDINVIYNDELGKISLKINNHIHKAEALIENERKFKENLEKRVSQEVEKNMQKELLIFQQSKLASMGEMIGNIAHQWRQPLSVIASYASAISLQKELGILSDDELYKMCEKIKENTERLSQIIDTFRNYLMDNKEIENVILQDKMKQSLEIMNIVLKDNKIQLQEYIDNRIPITVAMIVGEFSEVIINIVNNAKDVLIDNKIDNPWIRIELIKVNDKAYISIEDNGGGIPEDIIFKVFDQHFTTKEKTHGTGIGLYMSKEIITQSLKGELYVKNTFNGAKFTIELPIINLEKDDLTQLR